MPDTSLLTPSTLADEMRAHTGLFTEKTFDWDAFPASRGIPDLSRAQLRYVGAGGSPKVGDPSTLAGFSTPHNPRIVGITSGVLNVAEVSLAYWPSADQNTIGTRWLDSA